VNELQTSEKSNEGLSLFLAT